MKEKKISPWIQVRASEQEKLLAKRLADEYNTDVSNLVRALLQYAARKRPALTTTVLLHESKNASAPAGAR